MLTLTALDNAGKFSPLAINAITRSFYVDDLLLSVDTETAISLAHELLAVVGSAGFQLTKWVSNCQAVLDSISQDSGLTAAVNLDLDDTPVCRTLGIQWDVKYDCLVDASKTPPVADTKRGVLSIISTAFDPLGLSNPFTLRAKLFLQQLWDEGIQ